VSRQNTPNDEFHKQAIKVWQPKTSSPLSKEGVREITENITGFFETLLKWDEADRRALDSSDKSPDEYHGKPDSAT
jgi:hypothetical protein